MKNTHKKKTSPLNPLVPSVLYIEQLAKNSISISEGILKKFPMHERRAYESVDEKSLS